ncbi:MAG: 16S rRNA (uracil(1498)-N(3))-methyltransferase [Gammaproteobacteria bacterium]|nr:16S rRNA (uracil(1498)-N(3))-methyltransferase [Gammaproteobacteria bacterium]
MKSVRLYQNTTLKVGAQIDLDKFATHHLLKVLRFPEGQNITLFNGDGFDYQVKVVSAKKACSVEVLSCEKNNRESSLNLTLAQGIAKGEKMDFLIQKAIELGVNRIIPVQTERCVVRLNGAKLIKRTEHWQKIASHACEQSGRSVVVEVAPAKTLSEVLAETVGSGYVLHHRAEEGLLAMKKTSKVTILIGPEGGLSDVEIDEAIASDFQPLLLGNRILRTETASLAAIANMQLLWGS